MSNTTKIIIAVIVVILIGGGTWYALSANKAKETTNPQSTTDQPASNPNTEQPSTTTPADAITITYTSEGFSPADATVKSGGAVTVMNKSDSEMEFASDPHPTHTINTELNTEDIEPGSSKTITVTKKGSWGFHNHYDPQKRGTLVVE